MTKSTKKTTIPIHGAESYSDSINPDAIPENERVEITKEDLRPPESFEPGSVLISLIANVKDIRNPADGELGTLYPEQAEEFMGRMETFMDKVYDIVPSEEWDKIEVIVLAGDTKLVTPGEDGISNGSQRAMDTGQRAIKGLEASMEKHQIDIDGHLTTHGKNPIGVDTLCDLNMLHETDNPNTVKFMEFMLDKYGSGKEFWVAYESDAEKEMRENLGVEGPSDIADRVNHLVDICSTIADIHRKDDPEKRVIVVAIGHYDNISPWVKQYILGLNPADSFVPIVKGSGLVIKKSKDGEAAANIGGVSYPIEIESLD